MRNLSVLFIVMVMSFVVAPSNILAGSDGKVSPIYKIAVSSQMVLGYCINTDDEMGNFQLKKSVATLVDKNHLYPPLQELAQGIDDEFADMKCEKGIQHIILEVVLPNQQNVFEMLHVVNVPKKYALVGACSYESSFQKAMFVNSGSTLRQLKEVPIHYQKFHSSAKKDIGTCGQNGTYIETIEIFTQ